MHDVLNISPVTRIEGHLDIEVTVETVDGQQQVIDAKCSGTMFRGFENILQGRDPRDAIHYTQRVCGVCPVSHAMASSLALESAFEVAPTDNGRIMRNLVLGANYLQSHVLHFYHLAAPDYIDTTGTIVDMSPWRQHHVAPDMIDDPEIVGRLLNNYVQALEIRRKAHRMGAIYGGRLPSVASFVPGGSSEVVTPDSKTDFGSLLGEIRAFIDDTYIPDVLLVAGAFPAYSEIGVGCGNLLAYGVFDIDGAGTKLLKRGRYTDDAYEDVDDEEIEEYVTHSWYTPDSSGPPSSGVTEPDVTKPGAYSFVKAPRYQHLVHEVGPLARMWVNGDYSGQYGAGTSVIDRVATRALEAKKIADEMVHWLEGLEVDAPVYTHKETPDDAVGVGLTEAPRGALGHWLEIADTKISRYQIVTPTAWNASPKDDEDQHGAMEQALVGTPVEDLEHPIEVLRVVHSFDPCLACAVHMVRPDKNAKKFVVEA